MAGMKRNSTYWRKRQSKQFSRFTGKSVSAFTQPSVGGIAKAAWSGVKYLRTLVNSEVHKLDGTETNAITSSGAVVHLSGIAQGDTVSGRTGNSVLTKYLSYRHIIVINASATTTHIRVIIFRDNQQVSDTSPAVTDVLNTASCTSFLNAANAGRFQILSDKFIRLAAQGPQSVFQKVNLNENKHIRFNGTSGSDVQKGGLYALFLSDQGTNTAGQEFRWRLAYHDN